MTKLVQEDISREKKKLKKELSHLEKEEILVKNKAVILKEKEKHQVDEF
jgi:muramoyltetrapeptide carboxypeptidase LdcA involved in peptidoglycan recycling